MDDQLLKTPVANKQILTRQLPKTGQITSYNAGDDGDHEAGWWRGRSNANNLTRFVARTIAGDDVVIDRATGLMWAADGIAAGGGNGLLYLWAAAVNYFNPAFVFAGWNDWRLPNTVEHITILNYGALAPTVYPPFVNIGLAGTMRYWTSTTNPLIDTVAYYADFGMGLIGMFTKTPTPYHILGCRNVAV